LRGCITTGREWIFFVYKCHPEKDFGEKFFDGLTLKLEEGPALISGLLKDMVQNAVSSKLTYFQYE